MSDKLLEGTKNDSGKVRLDLVPPEVIIAIGEILTFGSQKYQDWNWAKGIKYSRVYAALQRHLLSYMKGEKFDPETGKSHLWHAACNLTFLITFDEHPEKYSEFNDLFAYSQKDE